MRLDDIKYSLENLFHKKIRSFLTTLSILIGIMAVFALISFGLGIRDYANTLAEDMGKDKLFLAPKAVMTTDPSLMTSQDDIDFVGKIQGVKDITGLYYGIAEVKYDGETRYVDMMGYDTEKTELVQSSMTVDIAEGRILKKAETGKAVLGYNYMLEDKVFSKPLHIGSKIEVNNQPFEVVGFFEAIGNPADDQNVYISYESFERLNPQLKDRFTSTIIQSASGYEPSKLADTITDKLRRHKGLDEGDEDFYVQTFEDVIATFGVIINIINGVLVLIALISVVVAAVNIMNTMYTSVLERTKEIGIMKAIGARNSDILNIFLLESGVLGLLGGLFGIFFGFLVAKIGEAVAANAGLGLLKPIFPWYLIAGCLLFAFLVGSLSGLAPAKQAAAQKPVDSLRYE